MRALFECNSTSLRALGISINFISERSSAWQFLWYFPLLTKKVHTKKFYMILFSLQKSIQKTSNLIFRFYFTNCNQKLCNSAFSLKQTKLKNVLISKITKLHIWLQNYNYYKKLYKKHKNI